MAAPELVSSTPLKVFRFALQHNASTLCIAPLQAHMYISICACAPKISGGDVQGVPTQGLQLPAYHQQGSQVKCYKSYRLRSAIQGPQEGDDLGLGISICAAMCTENRTC